MAVKGRSTSRAVALDQALHEQPYAFDFYQALRRIECAYLDKPRLGQSRRPIDDPVRLAQQPSLAFAPSTLASYELGDNGLPPTLAVYFFGLFGPNGPLPLHLTEYARDRLRNTKDSTFSDFVDIFHHRMLALFYRAWANSQPTVNYDRPEQDRFAVYVGASLGMGMPSLRNRDAMPDLAKLNYAGLMSNRTRNASGLIAMISDFFGMQAGIEQFVGEWLEIPENYRCRLGRSPETGTLGVNASLGTSTWQCQHKFRIVLGPLSREQYQRLLPGQESYQRLIAMVRNYLGDSLSWDVNLVLYNETIPPLALGRMGQLGWTTWLGARAGNENADDLIVEPTAASAC